MNAGDRAPSSYDLHLHTFWSYDATAQVDGYFRRARELGTRCIAITDHHVLDSLPDVLDAVRRYPDIITVPAAELTVTTSVGAVDLLCYGFPLDIPRSLAQLLERYRSWQRENGAAISTAMRRLGHDFSDLHRLELLERYRPARALKVQGATPVKHQHLRAYFVERGFIADEAAYAALWRRLRDALDFPPYPDVREVVPVVKDVGALVAIAHPHAYFDHGDGARMDLLRRECELDGVECAHKKVPVEFTPRYRAYCVEHGLFSTGGSDCHGDDEIVPAFALHGGPADWLDEFLERVGERAIPPADPARRTGVTG